MQRHLEAEHCVRPERKPEQRVEARLREGDVDGELGERATSPGLEGRLVRKKINFDNMSDPMLALDNAKSEVFAFLRQRLADGPVKFYIVMLVEFEKDLIDGEIATQDVIMPTGDEGTLFTLLREGQLAEFYREAGAEIQLAIDNWMERGSGWRLRQVRTLYVETGRYKPIKGSSFIKTPQNIVNKKAVINVKNEDQSCFEYSILASLHYHDLPHKKNADRPASYRQWFGKELDMRGMSEPVQIAEIDKFEKNNKLSVNVWLISEKGGSVDPLRISENDYRVVDLLLIEGEETSHYCWIRSLERLMYDREGMAHHFHRICHTCGRAYDKRYLTPEKWDFHQRACRAKDAQRVIIPEDRIICFKDWSKTLKAPVVIYADFECLNEKLDSCQPPLKKKGRKGEGNNSYTEMKTLHKVCGYSFTVVSPYYPGKTFTYRMREGGVNAAEHFIRAVNDECYKISAWLEDNKKEMTPLTAEQEKRHLESTHCHICKDVFEDNGEFGDDDPETRIHDHCHHTGEYRGAAHNQCNLMYRKHKKVPLFIHNLSGYDAALIMQQVHTTNYDPKVLARNLENFLTFDINNTSYRDSFQHLPSSLSTLVNNLKKNLEVDEMGKCFPNLYNYFCKKWKHLPPDCFNLLSGKLSFPYAYFDSLQRFEECELPPIEAYYNDLMEECLTDEDYEEAKNIYSRFGLKNLGELHDLYVETDVLLLADVFENYRNICMKTYSLDPAHFVTAPALSWSAALLYTGVELEIPVEADMHEFFDEGEVKFQRENIYLFIYKVSVGGSLKYRNVLLKLIISI